MGENKIIHTAKEEWDTLSDDILLKMLPKGSSGVSSKIRPGHFLP